MNIRRDLTNINMKRRFRNVFSTEEGRAVLTELVYNWLGAFRNDLSSTNPGDIALSNCGVDLLNFIGCSAAHINTKAINEALLNTPITISREE